MAIDVYSRHTFAKACTRATANVILDFLEKEIFNRFETPEIVTTDNGTQFTSLFFKLFLMGHGVRHVFVPNYHPQANPVEATNKSIKTLLRAELLRRANHVDWSSYLSNVIMKLNTTPRMPPGPSPYFIIFGREKCQTGDEHRLINDANHVIQSEEVMKENREIIYEQAAEQQRAAFEQNKKR